MPIFLQGEFIHTQKKKYTIISFDREKDQIDFIIVSLGAKKPNIFNIDKNLTEFAQTISFVSSNTFSTNFWNKRRPEVCAMFLLERFFHRSILLFNRAIEFEYTSYNFFVGK